MIEAPTRARIAAAVAAIAVGAIGTALSLSFAVTRSDPARALAAWPWNAAARAEAAADLLTADAAPAVIARAQTLAAEALAAQPVSVAAARVLGLTAALRERIPEATRAMAYAELLSRRDLPTELWLIEDRVAKGDVAGAVRHYDRALRVSESAPDLLFPVLIPAAGDIAVAQPLARTLSTRPLWWRAFVTQFVNQSPSYPMIVLIVRSVRLDPADAEDRELLVRAMQRLAHAGRTDLAAALAPAGGAAGRLRNGGFEAQPQLPPFDWTLAEDADLGAFIEPREGAAGDALYLSAQNGRGGEVARQLLMLPPGRYRLRGRGGDMAEARAERPAIGLVCAGGGAAIGSVTAGNGGFSGGFAVPAGCAGQWLMIQAPAAFDRVNRRPWLDDLEIDRL